jgi:hypothetical protein
VGRGRAGTLRAVIDHHASHLGDRWEPMLAEIYAHAAEEVSHW